MKGELPDPSCRIRPREVLVEPASSLSMSALSGCRSLGEVAYGAPISVEDILAIWQPGDAEYDQHPQSHRADSDATRRAASSAKSRCGYTAGTTSPPQSHTNAQHVRLREPLVPAC